MLDKHQFFKTGFILQNFLSNIDFCALPYYNYASYGATAAIRRY